MPARKRTEAPRPSSAPQKPFDYREADEFRLHKNSDRLQGRDALEYLTSACASLEGESGSICLVPDSG
jgi:hypothetical protein